MKTMLHLLIAMLLLPGFVRAQDTVSFTMSIIDPAYVPTVEDMGGMLQVTFQQGDLNGIMGGYNIYAFQKAYPTSRLEHLQQVYFISANSANLMDDLQNAYPGVFLAGRLEQPARWLFTPSDTGFSNHKQKELEFIHAPEAWDIDSGDRKIVIGITDEWVNRVHDDLKGKFTNRYVNPLSNSSLLMSHGTFTSGEAAGNTNNDTGYASVGYLCRLSDWEMKDNCILQMSNDPDSIRVINASWANWFSDTLDFTHNVSQVDLYNEVYENGTLVVAAAGNSGLPGTNPNTDGIATSYQFPASYDHVISVSSVGHQNAPIIPFDSANHESNVEYYHLSYFPDKGEWGTMSHNSRVDLCAPGFDIKGLCNNFILPNGTVYGPVYYCSATGSSCSAPLVSGTVGLMLHAALPCKLSPYQMAYVLKNTTDRLLYGQTANAPFAGKLGTGILNVFNAVWEVKPGNPSTTSHFRCNDTIFRTMYIDSLEFNTRCAPGHSTNGVLPTFSYRIVNGRPPYSYRWTAIPGNTTRLNSYTTAFPSIDSAWTIRSGTPPLAYYLLTVTDASPVEPKVASIRIKLALSTMDGISDLAMRDSYFDMLDEPNTQANIDPRNGDIWSSPDLWNRLKYDGGTRHQNPEFFSGGDSNWMYVRVRNVGCGPSPKQSFFGPHVRLYWTLASPGERWPRNWINRNIIVNGVSVLAGDEITPPGAPAQGGIPLSIIQPGSDTVISQWWKPQNPILYGNDTVEVCGLARIETSNGKPYGMTFSEDTVGTISTNVRNNNNIVTRNMILLNLGRTHARIVMVRPLIANADNTGQYFSIKLFTDNDIHKEYAGNLSEYLYARLRLDPTLFERWQLGGSHGVFGSVDSVNHTIIYDPATPLRLDSIYLDTNEYFPLEITFALRDSVAVEFPFFTHIYLQQTTGTGDSEQVYGQVGYELNIEADSASGGGGEQRMRPQVADENHFFDIYPNPVTGLLNVRYKGKDAARVQIKVSDISGRTLLERCDVSMQPGSVYTLKTGILTPGVYLIRLQDATGKTISKKFVKE